MSERMHEDENTDSPEGKISSRYGLRYTLDASGSSFHLDMPMDIVRKVGGIKVIQDLYTTIFDGSAVDSETSFKYFVQFPINTPIVKVQALVDAIERRNVQ
jgi:hypothetical protein